MPFSEKLKKLREENHYTQKYVAKHLNVARSTIAGYETKNRQPSHEKLTILAELFHVSVDYLLDDDISEITLSDKSTAQKSEHYLLTHFHRLSNSSKKELLRTIFREICVEQFLENGSEYFASLRFINDTDASPAQNKPWIYTLKQDVDFSADKYCWPIPEAERLKNKLVDQNPGLGK